MSQSMDGLQRSEGTRDAVVIVGATNRVGHSVRLLRPAYSTQAAIR
jgi:hypothetical protein